MKGCDIKSISKPLMIMGRNLHPLTEYVNRRVQEFWKEALTRKAKLIPNFGHGTPNFASP